MPGPLPPQLSWGTCPLLTTRHRPSPREERVGALPRPVQRLHARCLIAGLQSLASLQASRFAGHPGRSQRYDTVVWQPGLLRPSTVEGVTFLHVGYARRPNRATDGRGFSPPSFAALSAAPRTPGLDERLWLCPSASPPDIPQHPEKSTPTRIQLPRVLFPCVSVPTESLHTAVPHLRPFPAGPRRCCC